MLRPAEIYLYTHTIPNANASCTLRDRPAEIYLGLAEFSRDRYEERLQAPENKRQGRYQNPADL